MNRSRLPVPVQCKQSWDDLTGAGATRFCSVCNRKVHDLSARTRWGVQVRLLLAGPSPCVRFQSRLDGTITFRPGVAARVLGALVGLLPVQARAADDQVTVLSWVAQARAALAPETRREEQQLDFGGVGGLVNQAPVRTDVHPHGPAGLDVHTAPGRWDEATVRCDGSPGVRSGRFADGQATVRGLPEDTECRLVLSGGERPARLELVAGRTDAQVEIPVRRRSRRTPPSR